MELIDRGLIVMGVYTVYLVGKQILAELPPLDIAEIFHREKSDPCVLHCNGVSFNMKVSPHLLVAGLSGQGKSKFVEYLFKDRVDIEDIYLVNAYSGDFKSLNCNRINDTTDILSLLTEASTALQEHPRYIIVDELLELSIREPKIMKELTKALAVARHYNTFFVCIAQQATKEEIKCKSLFNCRVTFKQVEYSSYQTILGYSPEDKQLSQREFYYLSDSETGRAKVPRL